MEVFVDLGELGLSPSTPFSTVVEQAEHFIEQQNIKIVYLPNAQQNPWMSRGSHSSTQGLQKSLSRLPTEGELELRQTVPI
jgi:hypothetical protein